MKIHKVVLTDTANECLFNIAKYIALDSPMRAEKFIEDLVESLLKTLSIFPLAGKVYEDIETNVEIRRLVYQKYVSFYRVRNDSVEILFIFNSAQNIKAILNAMILTA